MMRQHSTRVSTHSRPKAAGSTPFLSVYFRVCFNTQPPEGGWFKCLHKLLRVALFQHTAARRRLAPFRTVCTDYSCFNTQPPEGGWRWDEVWQEKDDCFNTQPPEGGWPSSQRLGRLAA